MKSNVKADYQMEVIVSIVLGYSGESWLFRTYPENETCDYRITMLKILGGTITKINSTKLKTVGTQIIGPSSFSCWFQPWLLLSSYLSFASKYTVRIFLGLQLISAIEFITWWNNYWMPNNQSRQR
ncbi:hypothetical protein HID58_062803 [Brassica napus]|uniref:Uncharacterized protein n=1 Tax=Brassica napus TaxID=3708 RepID=A0ABQ8A2H6_BRANA|nr:hypothetical protein HID58_062803 [Brassica napus]